MIRLDLSTTPRWLDLGHGLRLQVLPVTTAIMVAARNDPDVEALPKNASQEQMAVVMAKAVARRVVTDWEGVGDANGKPVPVTPEGIDALLDIWPIFETFQTRCLAPHLMLDAEKNVSSPLPNGTSAGAKAIARPAKARAKAARHG
ncbi:hypothetical protein [Aquamicrobium defluvii]|uniref:Uncharacterized protein n=1 Tax=Aquamicrobium defluvii TaxID=69279 RepID=A0A011URR6_9HYPH|nr:hypothetical protein [Aquamicrobium defluvii]EXL08901.1 hypothetical protein BG36_02225 [Aquamicrobium defluvii]EZQ16099.1 hypothetical protein CF98_41595 [Halopseudomonas bauzanensis]